MLGGVNREEGVNMAEKLKEKIDKAIEANFESLIFPFKKLWITGKPVIRARKSVVKKNVTAFNSGSKEKAKRSTGKF